jgi:hypothetical protein
MVDHAGGAQVEDAVADRHADAWRRVAGSVEAAERQVLDREVAARLVGRGDPAAQQGIVGGVEGRGVGVHVERGVHGLN